MHCSGWQQKGACLSWQGDLGAVVEGTQGHHGLVIELQEEVCGQLQGYGNEEKQAVAEVVDCSHVSLHCGLVPWQQCLHTHKCVYTWAKGSGFVTIAMRCIQNAEHPISLQERALYLLVYACVMFKQQMKDVCETHIVFVVLVFVDSNNCMLLSS